MKRFIVGEKKLVDVCFKKSVEDAMIHEIVNRGVRIEMVHLEVFFVVSCECVIPKVTGLAQIVVSNLSTQIRKVDKMNMVNKKIGKDLDKLTVQSV